MGVEKSRGRRSYPGPVDKSIGEKFRDDYDREVVVSSAAVGLGQAFGGYPGGALGARHETGPDPLTHVMGLDRFTGL